MKWWIRILAVAIVAGGVIATFAVASFADSPGQKLFMANKCNTCHTINSLHITRTGSLHAPDLSKVGSQHDAKWFQAFLTRKESLDGKKHPKMWSGADADLTTLTNWLATLK